MGDLHVQEGSPRVLRPVFARISQEADVLLMCGDLTNMGLSNEAECLAGDLEACRIPALAVLGNHDYERGQQEEIKGILQTAGVVFLEDQTYKLGAVGFAGVKGFAGGFDTHMLASFGEHAVKAFVGEALNESAALENHLRALNTERKVVMLHYSPIAKTVHGEPLEIWPFLGCSRLAETIDRFDVNVVFHGHAHHGDLTGTTAQGVPVYNCALAVLKHRGHPLPYVLVEV